MLQKKMTFSPVQKKEGIQLIRNVSSALTLADRLGGIRVRWDIGRNDYRVKSGLYSLGDPSASSPVLVTANYKLTFDSVRKELTGENVWILVLETRGVNVWCAAGKGTFGTEELIRSIRATALPRVVVHRELILPQLGAPGVAAHLVTSETGFKIRWGPVYARDIPAYLANGKTKTDNMRRVTFNLGERLAVAPVEISHAWPLLFATLAVSALLALPFGDGSGHRFMYAALALTGGIFAGTVLLPALLPVLPFRAFAAKGAFLGLAWSALMASLTHTVWTASLPALLFSVPLVSFLSMNFTGASTFTCQKGTEAEVKLGVPLMLLSALGGIVLAVVSYFRLGM